VLLTLVSRASVFLVTYDCSIADILSRYGCKFLSPQLSKISKMVSKSVKSVFDFLRLARSWLRIVAASGVNFSESVTAGAEICFNSENSVSISSRSARSVSSCDRSSLSSSLSFFGDYGAGF
jgi:hypothetical protein